jgi:hypothetical protein
LPALERLEALEAEFPPVLCDSGATGSNHHLFAEFRPRSMERPVARLPLQTVRRQMAIASSASIRQLAIGCPSWRPIAPLPDQPNLLKAKAQKARRGRGG